ncbi:MAG TPA: methionine ABC transporter ATP-binding protein, partial [Firmicutes bacterium]|nr:methionine ABC transporter ATP-binding protein [Bacillota bacterium]
MLNVVRQDIITAGTAVNAARPAVTSAGTAVVPVANAGTAVNLEDVSKVFTQWQRSGKFKDLLRNLVKPEKKVVAALDHVSLKVNNGEFVAYAGANGAGKSTTIKILSGILQPTSGAVTVLGMSPEKSRVELMRRIGVVFGQRTELWWDHPISVSFEWKKTVWNIPAEVYRHQLEMVTELLDLGDLLNTFARELSLGQRMRADLAMMLLHNPELIFLDEPTLGLDVLAKRQMINFLKRINREQGTTIIVTSHDMDDLEEMAQRIVLLSRGQIAFDGSFDELRQLTGNLCRI